MNRAYPVSAEDPAGDCPVPISTLSQLYRAEPEALAEQLGGIPEATRARLAIYLYGRNHTRHLGVQIAVTCEGSSLRRVAGFVGNALYDLSRQNPALWSEASPSNGGKRGVSLAGASAAARRA
ncbi:hypothetical protein MKK63_10005 [Methylobacterium sp. J-088]|uniref:hypothetical protein n=1 Tax=unclassified Methylobacterium TaxID=2615210 RepID=UPI001FB90A14|nr:MULTISPECIES: hypothetical protein [unclassified Methylobacterium]MCJ2020524.1 hypothetical protein [Methylobacterium sp. E-065]MCJ2063041.1 hypothetical protein [Methylobacterium sp. J-088]